MRCGSRSVAACEEAREKLRSKQSETMATHYVNKERFAAAIWPQWK